MQPIRTLQKHNQRKRDKKSGCVEYQFREQIIAKSGFNYPLRHFPEANTNQKVPQNDKSPHCITRMTLIYYI